MFNRFLCSRRSLNKQLTARGGSWDNSIQMSNGGFVRYEYITYVRHHT